MFVLFTIIHIYDFKSGLKVKCFLAYFLVWFPCCFSQTGSKLSRFNYILYKLFSIPLSFYIFFHSFRLVLFTEFKIPIYQKCVRMSNFGIKRLYCMSEVLFICISALYAYMPYMLIENIIS